MLNQPKIRPKHDIPTKLVEVTTSDDLKFALIRHLADNGIKRKAFARELNTTFNSIHAFLGDFLPCPKRIAEFFGFEKVVVYRKIIK